MKTIYIVGGDGFARECYLHLRKIIKKNPYIKFGGFLGHGGYGKTVNYRNYQNLYICEVSNFTFSENDFVIIGAGYPNLRYKIFNELKKRKIKFFNLIDCDCLDINSIKIGEGNIIISSSISTNITIGNGNVFNGNIIVGHDVKIGDFNFFGPRSQILGNAKIGNNNKFGANSILLPKSTIGNNNLLAPLSVIYKGCKNNCYLLGNPALKIGDTE